MSLENLSYPQLLKLKQDLVANVPSDPTFMAAAGTLLRALIEQIIGAAKEKHDADQAQALKETEAAAAEAPKDEMPSVMAPEPVMAEAEEDSHPRRRR